MDGTPLWKVFAMGCLSCAGPSLVTRCIMRTTFAMFGRLELGSTEMKDRSLQGKKLKLTGRTAGEWKV